MYRCIHVSLCTYCAAMEGQQAGFWERDGIAFGQSQNSPRRGAFFSASKGRTGDLMTFSLMLLVHFPELCWACLTSLDALNCSYVYIENKNEYARY